MSIARVPEFLIGGVAALTTHAFYDEAGDKRGLRQKVQPRVRFSHLYSSRTRQVQLGEAGRGGRYNDVNNVRMRKLHIRALLLDTMILQELTCYVAGGRRLATVDLTCDSTVPREGRN